VSVAAPVRNRRRQRADDKRKERRQDPHTDRREYRGARHDEDEARGRERCQLLANAEHARKNQSERARHFGDADEANEEAGQRDRPLLH
jgi:hypothetical protein